MKPEFRRELAQLSFEEKIRKVGELIRLSRKSKNQRSAEESGDYPQSGRSSPAAAGNPKLF
jgi:hypothetical protein